MELERIGRTEISPPTVFLWDTDSSSLVEATVLGEDTYLVRATKAYRLLKQDPEGRESWSRNINKLNEYLESTFSNFRLSVDYVDRVSGETLRVKDEAREVAGQAKELLTKAERLNKEISDLQESLEISVESMETQVKRKLEGKKQERQRVLDELDHITRDLERRKDILQEWEENGVLSAILFQFSTEAEVVSGDAVNSVIEDHLEQAFNYHRRKVLQTLRGENFRLVVEELEEPSVLMRGEYGMLLNPAVIEDLEESYENTGVDDDLVEARQQAVKQFEEYAVEDLELEESVVEQSNATPAKAVDSILKRLETERVGEVQDVPNDGPYIGTVTGTSVVVGFDPAEYGPHYYIAGSTGSGKSHLKRALLENCVSEGYDVLALNPTSTQSVGISLPNESNSKGTGIATDQYWIGDNQLKDRPDDLDELLYGINAVTLKGLSEVKKKEFAEELFQKLYDSDHSHNPLYVFVDEAQNFDSGRSAQLLQQIAQEGRKFSVNLVLVSQSPKAFSYNTKEVRRNTSFILLNAKYAPDIQALVDSDRKLNNLKRGEAVFADFIDLPEFVAEVRDIHTRLWPEEPSDAEIGEVDKMFEKKLPQVGKGEVSHISESGVRDPTVSSGDSDSSVSLSEAELELVEHIKEYIEDQNQLPSTSKCWREGPFGSSKTGDLLEKLEKKGVVESETETRYGNEATVYSLSRKYSQI